MKISFVLFSSALAWFSGDPLPRDADLWEIYQLRTDQLFRDAIEGLLKNNFRLSNLERAFYLYKVTLENKTTENFMLK